MAVPEPVVLVPELELMCGVYEGSRDFVCKEREKLGNIPVGTMDFVAQKVVPLKLTAPLRSEPGKRLGGRRLVARLAWRRSGKNPGGGNDACRRKRR